MDVYVCGVYVYVSVWSSAHSEVGGVWGTLRGQVRHSPCFMWEGWSLGHLGYPLCIVGPDTLYKHGVSSLSSSLIESCWLPDPSCLTPPACKAHTFWLMTGAPDHSWSFVCYCVCFSVCIDAMPIVHVGLALKRSCLGWNTFLIAHLPIASFPNGRQRWACGFYLLWCTGPSFKAGRSEFRKRQGGTRSFVYVHMTPSGVSLWYNFNPF